MSRIGKIGRLSRQIRTEINHRLDDGEESDSILAWLNGLPFVQEMLEEQFDGVPISPQNLSEWRQGGFREWEFRRELIEQACSASDFADDLEDEVISPLLAGKLAALVAARYASLLNQWDGSPNSGVLDAFYVLRGINKDIALLQKTLHQAQKQKREHEKAIDDDEKWELEEEKKRATAPIYAKLEAEALALSFGGDENAKKIAEYLIAVKHDLPPPPEYRQRAAQPKTEPSAKEAKNVTVLPLSPVSSKPIKANQGKTGPDQGNLEHAKTPQPGAEREDLEN